MPAFHECRVVGQKEVFTTRFQIYSEIWLAEILLVHEAVLQHRFAVMETVFQVACAGLGNSKFAHAVCKIMTSSTTTVYKLCL